MKSLCQIPPIFFVIAAGFALSPSLMATDLQAGPPKCGASPSNVKCTTTKGRGTSLKFTYANSSSTGGGPLNSPNTILHFGFPPCGGSSSPNPPTCGIPFQRVTIFDNDGNFEDVAINMATSRSLKMATPNATWDGENLEVELGTLEAGASGYIIVYFVFGEVGEIPIDISIEGDLTDPDMSNNSFQAVVNVLPPQTELLYPWVSNNAGQFESILIANNYGNEEAVVTLTARRAEGDPETVQRTIPAKGQLRENASELFPDLGSGSGYTVVLTSNISTLKGGWVTYNLTTQTSRSPSQGVAIDVNQDAPPYHARLGSQVMYNFLPTTESFISAPVLVNPGPDPVNVTLRFYNQDGELILEDRDRIRNLAPNRPFAVVANQLLPENAGDVYMIASSETGRITGVSFVFNQAGEPSIGNVSGLAMFAEPQ